MGVKFLSSDDSPDVRSGVGSFALLIGSIYQLGLLQLKLINDNYNIRKE